MKSQTAFTIAAVFIAIGLLANVVCLIIKITSSH